MRKASPLVCAIFAEYLTVLEINIIKCENLSIDIHIHCCTNLKPHWLILLPVDSPEFL
jgi:hypothetical protein